jgi:signal transduction histidine kinase
MGKCPKREFQNGFYVFSYRDTFGEVLRHELNNPLSGILGNAELLRAEMRRQRSTQFSDGNLKRLETIAALAVRMGETVRRLSQACEARAEQARSA